MEIPVDLCELNKYKLDEEASHIAADLQTIGAELAECRIKKDQLEFDVKRLASEVEIDIRKSEPKKFGLDKFTESSISALIETEKSVLTRKQTLIDARADMYRYESVVQALRDKSDQIKNLVTLVVSGFYAEPASNQNLRNGAMGKKE
jgi:hypothetical protein